MKRRKMILTCAAAFAIGVALAAQPTSVHADRLHAKALQRDPWVPGTDMVMSAHEAATAPLEAPR